MWRTRYLLQLFALAAVLVCAKPSLAQTIIDEWQGIKAPPAPELKTVALDPKTAALLVMDLVKQTCNNERRPRWDFPHGKPGARILLERDRQAPAAGEPVSSGTVLSRV